MGNWKERRSEERSRTGSNRDPGMARSVVRYIRTRYDYVERGRQMLLCACYGMVLFCLAHVKPEKVGCEMTFDEAVNKYLDENPDMSDAVHFGRMMYEAGLHATRRPNAEIWRYSGAWNVIQIVDGNKVQHKGGFSCQEEAKEWARSNGFEVC